MNGTTGFEMLEKFVADMRASGYELKLVEVPNLLTADSVTVEEEFSFTVGSGEDEWSLSQGCNRQLVK